MKKFYSFMLCALVALLGFSASALTITVKADPTKVSRITMGTNTVQNDVQFSVEGTENTLDLSGYVYFKVYTVESGAVYNSVVTSADGSKSYQAHTNKNVVTWGYFLASTYEGGTLEVTVGTADKPKSTVFIEGDPSKVKLEIGQTVKPLVAGANQIEYDLSGVNSYLTFTPTDGKPFYKFQVNGVDKAITSGSTEGDTKPDYYFVSKLANNSTIYIETEWPVEETYTVTIRTNNENANLDFVTEVTLNGTVVEREDWENGLAVNGGDEFHISCDMQHYMTNGVGMMINGVEPAGFSGNYGRVIDGDLDLYFDVTPIVRNKSFTVVVDSSVLGEADVTMRGTNSYFGGLASGSVVEYCYADFPIYVEAEFSTSTEVTDVKVGWINDELYGKNIGRITLTTENLNDGDVIKFTTEKPYITVNATNAEGIVTSFYGKNVTLSEGSNELKTKLNQDDETITFTAAENYDLEVLHNGEAVEPVDGVYSFEIVEYDEYDVTATKRPLISFTATKPEGLYGGGVIIDDYLVVLEDGVTTTVNLNDYELDEDSYITIACTPGAPYYLESVLRNGEELVGSEDDLGGFFKLAPEAGDDYVITVADLVRDQQFTLFVNGVKNVANPFFADLTRNACLANNLTEGYSTVNFATVDNPVNLNWEVLHGGAKVFMYVNDKLVDGYSNTREFKAKDGDVVHVFFAAEQPDYVGVVYLVYGTEDRPAVTVDHCRQASFADVMVMDESDPETPVFLTYNHFGLPGTHVAIAVPEGDTYNDVVIDGEDAEANADGEYELNISDSYSHKVEIYANESTKAYPTGIANVAVDAENGRTVYNLQGIRVNGDELPAGVYIINGKKVMVK